MSVGNPVTFTRMCGERGTLGASLMHLAVALSLLCALCGCGNGVAVDPTTPVVPGSGVQGRVMAGRQAVSNAAVILYAAGLTGSGTGATSLLSSNTLRTDANGYFTIPRDYMCPSTASQIYVVARGGSPGVASGQANSALEMVAALGNCGNLTGAGLINVDEVTTVAVAWALSQFFGADGAVGSSSTNATGLLNAFSTAANLADPLTGLAPGTALPQGAVLETAKVNALANALATCSRSSGASGCGPLFLAAGVSDLASPTTLDAALHIVRQPGANVASVYKVAIETAGPFQPALASVPNDWTMSITMSGGGLNQPGALAVDSMGSVWVANYFGAVVSKFLSTGAAASSTGFPGVGLHQSFGVAVDPQDDVWVSNETSVSGANNSRLGSLSKFSTTGSELSSYGYTGGGLFYPQGIASDPAGHIWVANYGASSASLIGNDGTAISGAMGFGTSELPFTPAVALDANRNAWFAVQQALARVTPAGVVTVYPCCVDPAGIAVDQGGNLWLADYGGASVVKVSSSGGVVTTIASSNGALAAQGIAVDGAGTVWAANYRGNSLTEIAGTGLNMVSPVGGFGLDAQLNEPLGLAIDASGNLWMSNQNGNTVTEIVGLASPIRTPLLGPPASP